MEESDARVKILRACVYACGSAGQGWKGSVIPPDKPTSSSW